MSLPPEILCLVFGSLEKTALANVRLVCKSFEEAASPFLFDKVCVSHARADLEIARLTVLRFGHYVRILVFTPSYLDYDMHTFRCLVRAQSDVQDLVTKCFDQHLEYAWNNYIGHRDEWREVDESGELVGYLCTILGKTPRLQTITIRARFDFRPESGSACSRPVCTLHKKQFILKPFLRCLTSGARAWRSLMLALSITKVCVKNLIWDGSGGHWPIFCSSFDMLQARGLHVEQSFRFLIELRLYLTRYDHGIWRNDMRDAVRVANLAEILAGAINLEHLQLEFDEQPNQFGDILRGCRFTKLRSLEISTIYSTEDQLVGFLQFSPGLETLQLVSYNLTQGLWEHVARRVKQSLQLHVVQLDKLWGGIPLSWDESEPLRDSKISRDVDDFFLRDGENPFTKGAFERRTERSIPNIVSILQFSPCLKACHLQPKQPH